MRLETTLYLKILILLGLLCLLVQKQAIAAQCPGDYSASFGCTAQDIIVTGSTVTQKPPNCLVGTTFTGEVEISLGGSTNANRYQIGLYILSQGDNLAAAGNSCQLTVPSTAAPFTDAESGANACGDITGQGVNPPTTGKLPLDWDVQLQSIACNPTIGGVAMQVLVDYTPNAGIQCAPYIPDGSSKCYSGTELVAVEPLGRVTLKKIAVPNDGNPFFFTYSSTDPAMTLGSPGSIGTGGNPTSPFAISHGGSQVIYVNLEDKSATLTLTETLLDGYFPNAVSCVDANDGTPVSATIAGAGFSVNITDTQPDIECTVSNRQRDYSDAPQTATSYGDPTHLITETIRLGPTVTGESAGYDDINAAGDVDDGVTLPTLNLGASATITAAVTQSVANTGYLQAWIDWNGDGDFSDAGEQIATDLQLGSGTSGTISIPVTVPLSATTIQTFARLRWSTSSGLDAVAATSDGEVEDYALTILEGNEYGDAPDSYGTLDASNGAKHTSPGSTLFLGAGAADRETDGQPGIAASGDDGSGSDDEDGIVTLPPLSAADSNYSVTVNASNTTAFPARLMAWIDFDGNGTFDADEAAVRSVPAGTSAGSIAVTWSSIPPDRQAGSSYLRLRLTTDPITAAEAMGQKSDGEVEDYALTIAPADPTLSGRVYRDVNSNATADAGETGIGSTVVVLRNTLTNTCHSITTSADGRYHFLNVANGSYEIYQAHGETTPVPQNCGTSFANNPTGYQSTTPDVLALTVSGADVTDQDFGEVAGANSTVSGNTGTGLVFEPDHQSEILPGNVAFYAHVFSAEADGSVVFSSTASDNLTAGWSHSLYYDANCNGQLDGTEGNTEVSSSVYAVTAGSKHCLINKVYAPANTPQRDKYTVNTAATFSFDGSTAPAPVVLSVSDVTIAGQRVSPTAPATPGIGESRLKLRKTVENLTQSTAEVENINQAKPGDILRYRIYYRNTGTGPITDLKVNDNLPEYTMFVLGSESCTVTPPMLSCTPNRNQDALWWDFTGTLVGGAAGTVSYEVMVEN